MTRTRAIRLTFAILAIGFFATPIAARILGMTAEQFENRRFADPPKLSQGWDAFGQTTQFLTDRMPLRKQAVEANTRIWTDVFDTDPRYVTSGDQALAFARSVRGEPRAGENDGNDPLQNAASASTGRKGWLFLSEEFKYACDRTLSDAKVLDRWADLVAAIRATRRSAVMFAVPHKASVYPEHLPAKYPYDHCALEAKARLWRLLARHGRARGVVELRRKLLAMKRTEGDELFELRDMHWTTLGALALVDATLDEMGDGVELRSNEVVDRGLVPYEGDLDLVRGDRRQTMHREFGVERAGNAARVPGRTLLICDSFAYKWLRLFRPYFESLRFVSFYHPEDEIADAIERADRVVIEANEIFLKAQAQSAGKVGALIAELRRRG